MSLFFQVLLFFLISSTLISCSKQIETNKELSKIIDPETLYTEAINNFENKNYDEAIEIFQEIDLKFPLSNEAIQSQIMMAFIEYLKLEYSFAIIKLEKIISRYPSYKDIDYVYYLKAMCYYEQIENPQLDGQYNLLALQSFNQTINYFPNSEYAKDSQQKIILLKESIAGKHMSVGKFYLEQKKYLAAIKRYQKVIDEFSQTKYTPEALHRLVEIYFSLGMKEEARKYAAILGHNYPKNKWYKYSYNLVGDNNFADPEKNNLFKKILNKISSNNED